MKNLKQFILGLCGILTVSLFSCQNDVSDVEQTDSSEHTFTVTEDPLTKGVTGISGLGTYKTGSYVTLKAKSGATITGTRTRGSGSISDTYESGGYACADIDDIHGDWSVSANIPDYKVTVKAGTGGTASGGGSVEKGSSCSISATPNSGYTFDKWTISGDGKIANASSANTTVSPSAQLILLRQILKPMI